MDERIIFEDEPGEPSRSPLGLLVAIGIVAVSIAVVAFRPSDVNPNSLGASPPTTLFVPPEALTTSTTPTIRNQPANGLSLSQQVPGVRGAIHMEIATASSSRHDQESAGQLWIWNAAFDEPIRVDVPGSIDISANRRNALATSWNQAEEGVLWLGPKADVRPAQILPGLSGAVWSRDETERLATAQFADNVTTITIWAFSGADSDIVETVTLDGEWHLAYLRGDLVGATSIGEAPRESRARLVDWVRHQTTLDVPGVLVAGTSGPPVIARCADASCSEVDFLWIEDIGLIPAPGDGWPIPSSTGDHVAVFEWRDATSRTVIYDRSGNDVIEVPSHGFVGAWSGDGRFFVYPSAEAGFGDQPALVFVDTLEETYHEVRVPASGDWFVTRIWYGP